MTEELGISSEGAVGVPAAEAEALPPALESEPQLPFLVVALGASAGGLAPLKAFFQAMPVDSGMAFVVIQHLDPDRESLMTGLLQQRTAMPVVLVTDAMRPEANQVYMIPPGATMTLEDRLLRLRAPEARRGMRLPIDAFFTSLGEAQGRRAAGIVLSGTASDGTEGLRDIKAHGGLAIAQDPEEAEQEWMPRSAIATGIVDLVLPVAEMPEALRKYRGHPYVTTGEPEPAPEIEETLGSILTILNARVGHDFQGYRKSTLLRRIHRRMGFRAIPDLVSYEKYLRDSPNEASALFSDMLIGVTKFFREPEAWEALKKLVVRPLLEREGAAPVRVWVPGCSVGKEAYTLAMLFFSVMEELGKPVELQMFATDVATDSLAHARSGRFPLEIAHEVPPEYLERYFIGEEKQFRIVQKVRQSIVFAPQNALADPPFSRLDLVSCRNLLIYLEPEMQDRAMNIFHFSLNRGGYLFLGSAESIGPQELFHPLSKQWRIFQKLDLPRTALLNLPRGVKPKPSFPAAQQPGRKAVDGDGALHRFAESIVLERYSPSSIVINANDEIVDYVGPAPEFLRHRQGPPNEHLLTRLDDPLRAAVRSLIQEVRTSGTQGSIVGSELTDEGRGHVDVDVLPLRGLRRRDHLLVVMRRHGAPGGGAQEMVPVEPEARDFERELRAAREEMQGAIEQMESSSEELTASNEEMASMNEELQAANEELETSKEELQAVNEELRSVNTELEEKVAQEQQSADDLDNLLRSTNIPTLFLDEELRLRRFTPAAVRLFNFLPTDVGRPISDLSLTLEGMDLSGDARSVLTNLQSVTHEVQSTDGRRHLHRTELYHTDDGVIRGVVLTFVDITDLANSRIELLCRAEQLRAAALALTQVEHTERRRLAHAVHDGVQQWLIGARLKLVLAMDILTDVPNDDAMGDILTTLTETEEAVEGAIAEARDLTMQISPPVSDSKPLRDGLQWLAENTLERHGQHVHVDAALEADPEQQVAKVVLFEAARELLLNSVKHSGAKEANLTLALEDDDAVVLTVSDAGTGFDPSTILAEGTSFGLFSVRQRIELLGGTMEIESAPGHGATFRLRLPLRGPQTTEAPTASGGA